MKRQTHLLTIPDTPLFCFPESVGVYTDSPEHTVSREPGAMNNFNIHCVASGKGYVEVDGQVHELRRGDAVLYFPMQRQHYYSSKDEPWDIRWVHFYGSGTSLQDYLQARGMHKSRLWRLRQPEAWAAAHLELLSAAEKHRMNDPTLLSALTYAVIVEFVQQAVPYSSAKPGKSGRSAGRIAELLPLMQAEACKPFLLEEWAERAGVSPFYFCKLFRGAMEMTPMDFVTRCRLQAAKQLLLERPDDTVAAIAMSAGYTNASYFNKRFMAYEGMTPSEYRRLFGG